MSARLETRRDDTSEKCANCGWWLGKTAPSGLCQHHDIKTLDLAVCSGWRDGEPVQEILTHEQD